MNIIYLYSWWGTVLGWSLFIILPQWSVFSERSVLHGIFWENVGFIVHAEHEGFRLVHAPVWNMIPDKKKETYSSKEWHRWRIVLMNQCFLFFFLRWMLMSRSTGGENVKTQQETSAVFFEASQKNVRRWLPIVTKANTLLLPANAMMTCTLSSDHAIC